MIFVRYKRFRFMTTLIKATILKQFTIPVVIVAFPRMTIYTDCDTAISEFMVLRDTKTRLFWTYLQLKLL